MPFRRDVHADLPPSQAFHPPVNEMDHGDAHRPPQGDDDVTNRAAGVTIALREHSDFAVNAESAYRSSGIQRN